jgi:1-deoxy-D-xylulose 5-phosphate reductoisomerase
MLIGIELCKTALKIGGTMPAVLCIANDIAVKYFLDNKLLFGDIYRFIKFSMAECKVITNYNVSDILSIQNEVRDLMDKFLYKYKEV